MAGRNETQLKLIDKEAAIAHISQERETLGYFWVHAVFLFLSVLKAWLLSGLCLPPWGHRVTSVGIAPVWNGLCLVGVKPVPSCGCQASSQLTVVKTPFFSFSPASHPQTGSSNCQKELLQEAIPQKSPGIMARCPSCGLEPIQLCIPDLPLPGYTTLSKLFYFFVLVSSFLKQSLKIVPASYGDWEN